MVQLRSQDIWEDAKKRGIIEKIEEQVVFTFTHEEFEKCRFRMKDQNLRMVECTVHRSKFTHGYRLHPPHLWDIKEGKLYKKSEGKWVRWIPNFSNNLDLISEAKNSDSD